MDIESELQRRLIFSNRWPYCICPAFGATEGGEDPMGVWSRNSPPGGVSLAQADADRLDPGWRWEELRARPPLPALFDPWSLVTAARSAVPESTWKEVFRQGVSSTGELTSQPWNVALERSVAQRLAEELDGLEPALALARKLVDRPSGRLPLPETCARTVAVLGPLHQKARDLGLALQLDVWQQAERSNPQAALLATRAMIALAGAFGDTPERISQSVRLSIRSLFARSLGRVLAQTEPDAACLIATQDALADEAEEPILLHQARDTRAEFQATYEQYLARTISINDLLGGPVDHETGLPWTSGGLGRFIWGGPKGIARPRSSDIEHNFALGLTWLNQAVELARTPFYTQLAAWTTWTGERESAALRNVASTFFACGQTQLLALSVSNTHASYLEVQMLVAALSAERFRRECGGWPTSLADLDPYLPASTRSRRELLIERLTLTVEGPVLAISTPPHERNILPRGYRELLDTMHAGDGRQRFSLVLPGRRRLARVL